MPTGEELDFNERKPASAVLNNTPPPLKGLMYPSLQSTAAVSVFLTQS